MSTPLMTGRNIVGPQLYSTALSSLYQSGFRIYPMDFGESKDPDFLEKIKRDTRFLHAITTRQHRVAGRNWHMEPASDKLEDKMAAKIGEESFKRIENFSGARFNLASAVIESRSFARIYGERQFKALGGLAPQFWWMPTALKNVDRRRFYYEPKWETLENGERKLNVNRVMWSVERGRWDPFEHPEWYVKVVYDDREDRLGYGRGVAEGLYYAIRAKEFVLEEMLQGIERFAQGFILAKLNGYRAASKDYTNQNIVDTTLDFLAAQRGRHVAAVDKEDEIQLIQPTSAGQDGAMKCIEYLDQGAIQLVLGSVMPTGSNADVGSNARAQVESDSSEILNQFDRDLIDERITCDAVKLWWNLNRENFASVGLEAAEMPRIATTQEKVEDHEKNSRVIGAALTAGIALKKEEVYKKLGMTPPGEGDDVIEPRPAPSPFGGDSGFGGDEGDDVSSNPDERNDGQEKPEKFSTQLRATRRVKFHRTTA